jgi:type I restriction enzyme S subunit
MEIHQNEPSFLRYFQFYQRATPNATSSKIEVGDLIFCRVSSSKGLAGKCAIVRVCSRNLLLSDKTIRIPLMGGVNKEYVALHNEIAQVKAYFDCLCMDKSTSMNNITRDDLFFKPVPLPPIAEQSAIVERVEALMQHFKQLEGKIFSAKNNAVMLMQIVLKEAFGGA